MPTNCKHENLKFARFGCFMPELGVRRILWECVDCRTILSFNIQPASNKVLHPTPESGGTLPAVESNSENALPA
jgi:hypothetical protein